MRKMAGRRKCSLWIAAAIAVAQHLGLCPKPQFPVWAGITKKIIAVWLQLWYEL